MTINGIIKEMNSEYAPGVSAYGVDGKAGKDGGNGTSVFICIYDITSNEGVGKFAEAFLHSYDMTNTAGTKINRDYIDGDNFMFPDGTIWRVDNVSDLKNAIAVGQISTPEKLKEYLVQVGAIQGNTEDGFTASDSNMYLDNANYKGFVIDTTGNAGVYSLNSPLSIISNENGSDNINRFISLQNIFAGQSSTKFDIYYDNNTGAWVLDSDRTILINCDLKITYDNGMSQDYDEYSKPLLAENSITSFYGNCKGVKIYYGAIEHPDIVAEVDDGSPVTTITPKKKLSQWALSYPDAIQFDVNARLLDAYQTIYVRLGEQSGSSTKIYNFRRLNLDSVHYFTLNLMFNNAVMKTATIYKRVTSNPDYMFFNDNGLLQINVAALTKDVDIDENFSLRLIWSYPVPNTNESVDVTINIPFVQNKSIISEIPFSIDGNIDFLLGSWFHVTRWEDIAIVGEYHVPIDRNLVTNKEFSLAIKEDIPDTTKWQISAVNCVEVDLTVSPKS